MRAIIEIFLAIIFTIITGASVLNFSSKVIKKEALIKVQKGLPSLEKFTQRLTDKKHSLI
ncbi:putative membrane protein [Halobacteriovorax marinus SJ]|uniref:Membrane protein n=1 Tax=Halobacteriovorax marinus (strain ATCC BAA-682 / DSM 15412 / SJ) TaxID=862908 RepID=E1X5W8_HALMS|nr:putative membrane protein [Halobacteriovorax marinus SJ]